METGKFALIIKCKDKATSLQHLYAMPFRTKDVEGDPPSDEEGCSDEENKDERFGQFSDADEDISVEEVNSEDQATPEIKDIDILNDVNGSFVSDKD